MVFLGGPRQSGKTTLAKDLMKDFSESKYFNWDRLEDQKSILHEKWSDQQKLIIFDEIHKYPKWKNLVKGYYDTQKDLHKFLITGSARLDLYRRGGDSLLGRYHYWRLHPFDLTEAPAKIKPQEAFNRLMSVGGFPEPFFDNELREAKRWREERYVRIIKDDIRDLENVKNIQQMSLLFLLLRERAGSLIVPSNLAADLQVSPITIAKWIEIFERMYLVFIVRPYSKKLPRALVKPFKVYFFDNADVIEEEGSRFENLVASHLLKKCHFLQDYTGEKWELCFFRDKEKHEVDFVLVREGKVEKIIEAKWSDKNPSASLLYLANKLNPHAAIQIVANLKNDHSKGKLHIKSVLSFFKQGHFGF
jgi:predicted AAA+ superfamily ATPase